MDNQLQLVKSARFGETECNVYKKEDDFYMTREQIGTALEYIDPRVAISKIHARNKERLDRFSVVTRLVTTDGKSYETYLYSWKGVYEVCRWSNQPKANEFLDWAYDILESVRRGELIIGEKTSEYSNKIIEMCRAIGEAHKATGIDLYQLNATAQNTYLKILGQAGKAAQKESAKKQKEAAVITSAPEPGNMLQELLSHAVPIYGYKPKNDKEVKASVLRDGDNYYIFPEAVHYYLREYRAKKSDIYKEVRFLGGSGINKRFDFFGKKSRTYRVQVLPVSSNVVRLPG